MAKLVTLPDLIQKVGNSASFLDDFFTFTNAQMWTSTEGDSGASTVISTVGGSSITMTTGTTNENEVYVESTAPVCDVINNRKITCGIIFQYAEAATSAANVIFGLTDQTGVNLMANAAAGPAGTYEGALIYKIDGGTRWQTESSTGSTQTSSDTTVTAGGAAQQHLRITISPISSTDAEVVYEMSSGGTAAGVGGALNLFQPAVQGASPRQAVIKDTLVYANTNDLNLVFGIKAGSAASEVLTVDAVYFAQERAPI